MICSWCKEHMLIATSVGNDGYIVPLLQNETGSNIGVTSLLL
jgi:hypothetical protein